MTIMPIKHKGNSNVTLQVQPVLAILYMIAKYLIASILVLGLTRIILLVWLSERVEPTGKQLEIIITGLRFDLVINGFLLVLPVLILPFLGVSRTLQPIISKIFAIWLCGCFALIVFLEFATPGFIGEFDARPNILFVEYIMYPRQVLATLWGGYKVPLLASVTAVPALVWLFSVHIFRTNRWTSPLSIPAAICFSLIGGLLCGMAARSTFDHRPVNPSTAAVTSDALVNDLGLNSSYSVLYALYENQRDGDGAYRYGKGDFEKLLSHNGIDIGKQNIFDSQHVQLASRKTDRPLNLVFIVEESLGAEFVGSLGGLPLTPNLDSLKGQGIWFNNLYATGTRSVRGLEALISGFLPTTARSVVKLQKTQRNFFTIAGLLKEHGYNTSFLYGGGAQFDNMGRFFANNGFDIVLDKHDFEDAEFIGSWGVSDEDLFSNAHQFYSGQGDTPFFSLLFTTTNHSPFEYPAGRIEQYDEQVQTVNNAVKYADYALGNYLEKARRSNYWDSTVFLVVSDHNSRVYGDALLPVKRFHIPGVILGGSIEPLVVDTIASQIDILPTVLSLIGLDTVHPAVGRDLTLAENREKTGRAVMQFHASQGYMEGDQVIVLRRDLDPVQFTYDRNELIDSAGVDAGLLLTAYSYSEFPIRMIKESKYSLVDQLQVKK